MNKCETCARNVNGSVPMAVLENERAQSNVIHRRDFIIKLVLIILFVASNLGWLIYENQFETETTEVLVKSEDGGNANYVGNDGDIYNGEYQSKKDAPRP